MLTLKVGCIREDEEHPRWDLIIETADPTRVVKARKPLIDALHGDPMDVLTEVSARPKPLLVRYVHSFNVTKQKSTARQSWMVLGGLFCGSGNRLVEHAKEMLRLKEKAIPLAGCAARLIDVAGVETIAPVQGKLYCSLPIKRDTPLAFHVNGYFDTDSSRTDITTPGGLQGDDVTRAQWNLLLLEDAIAPCTAELIRTLVSLRPDTPAEALYKAFPPSDTSDLFKGFATSFYQSLIEAPVIRANRAGQRVWEQIGKTWMVPSALQAPLVEDGFVVAAPDVPAKLKAGFTKAGAKVNVLDPGILRKHLSCGLDVDCDLESAPQSSLRRREWILEALRFCYDAERPELLQGLPLALLADGRLHTFGKTEREWVFLATTEQRELFANQSHWFIDPQFCEDAGLVTKARGPLRRMSLKDVVDAIVVVLGQRTTSQYMDWIPAGDDVPNEAWLLKLFRYLAKVQKGELADANIEPCSVVSAGFQTSMVTYTEQDNPELRSSGPRKKRRHRSFRRCLALGFH